MMREGVTTTGDDDGGANDDDRDRPLKASALLFDCNRSKAEAIRFARVVVSSRGMCCEFLKTRDTRGKYEP